MKLDIFITHFPLDALDVTEHTTNMLALCLFVLAVLFRICLLVQEDTEGTPSPRSFALGHPPETPQDRDTLWGTNLAVLWRTVKDAAVIASIIIALGSSFYGLQPWHTIGKWTARGSLKK
uniref:Uncharacterized protein n=1 Tax=Anopheles maculatus TaxID=74869 RepID=A0A182S5U8_9DIPT